MTDWTVTEIADRVRRGDLSAVDAVTESLSRIDARDGDVHAFQVVRTRRALDEAAAIDARPDRSTLPLAGVPIAIKDNVPVAGEPMRVGSSATSDAPRPADHAVVERLRGSGAVVVGLTRVPELCIYGATDSVYGVSRNPWNPALTPGGSSGGSAAAVAAGMVPAAHGNDGLGSIRIPAACTGLFGIKPGLGLVPADLGRNDWYSMSENGPLATTVADAALLLSVMAGDPGLAEIRPVPQRLRVALAFRSPVAGVKLDTSFAAAAERAAALLRMDGHEVQRKEIAYPQSAAVAGLARWFAGVAQDVDDLDESRVESRVRTHARVGRFVRRTPLMSESLRNSWIRKARTFLTEYDVLITPALATPPIEAREWGRGSWAATMRANVAYAPYAAPWNVAGFPAASVPMGIHPVSGTPVAAQIVARPGGEALLLSVAAALEAASPWQRTAY